MAFQIVKHFISIFLITGVRGIKWEEAHKLKGVIALLIQYNQNPIR